MAVTKYPRKKALEIIRSAGIENDQKLFIRTYTEQSLSFKAAKAAFDEGRRMASAEAKWAN